MSQTSKILRFDRYRWRSVPLERYKDESSRFEGVTRQTLLGEGEDEGSLAFVTRYFEVLPGGYTSLEMHDHPHAVIVVRGAGRVILGREVHSIRPLDCVYVAPNAVHQFQAEGKEPLGFLCVVDRRRDRPVAVRGEEIGNDAARP
jgi:quercetin dioxygenase-like cupin family protein